MTSRVDRRMIGGWIRDRSEGVIANETQSSGDGGGGGRLRDSVDERG